MDFKQNPKMKSDVACYKEGGQVYKSRTHREDPSEAAEDKAMVKKGIRQHEAAKHKGEEKTEIKLKKGGRCKKEGGNVRKYKAGGVIEMKKTKEDKKEIAQTKKTKAGKAETPSAATGKKKESPKTDNKAAKPKMTASMVGALPQPEKAPSAALDMPEDQPIEMMADGGLTDPRMLGQGVVSENERQMLIEAAKQQQRRRGVPQGANFGALAQQAMQPPTPPGMGAANVPGPMGAAAAPGAMGGAAPLGATQDILRGLQAVGQYAAGGKAY